MFDPHIGLYSFIPYVMYVMGIAAFLLSIFWRPIVGIYYIIPLILLQTARYHMINLPLGKSVVDIILLGVALGLMVRGQPIFPKTPWSLLLYVYAVFTFAWLCLGSLSLHSELPFSPSDPRLADWKNYMVMPMILFLVAATAKEPRQMKVVTGLMCITTLILNRSIWNTVSGRDFSSFSYDLQEDVNGHIGYAGVNGLATYEAQIAVFLLALAACEKKWLLKLGYIVLAIFSMRCLLYSLSREGYLAFLVGCLFLGLVKQRALLVLLAVFLSMWTSLVPTAVEQRVNMTYDQRGQLDHSAQVRVDLWEEAQQAFDSRPLLGLGFDTYAYTGHVHGYKDSHNFFVKVVVETGIVGLLLFLWLLFKTFGTGYRLFRRARDSFVASLGLGLAAWVVCAAVANFFGDRWTYIQVNGYMWVLGGLVSRAWVIERGATPVALHQNAFQCSCADESEGLEPKSAAAL